MSSDEIQALTRAVAKTFGEDIAQETCRVFLERQPHLTDKALRWWRRTARFLRNEQRDKAAVRRAPRYWLEAEWTIRRRFSSPEQWAACWELVDRIPPEVTLQLVQIEGVRTDHTIACTAQRVLRRHAARYARFTGAGA
jgi:hypothetical protein